MRGGEVVSGATRTCRYSSRSLRFPGQTFVVVFLGHGSFFREERYIAFGAVVFFRETRVVDRDIVRSIDNLVLAANC